MSPIVGHKFAHQQMKLFTSVCLFLNMKCASRKVFSVSASLDAHLRPLELVLNFSSNENQVNEIKRMYFTSKPL